MKISCALVLALLAAPTLAADRASIEKAIIASEERAVDSIVKSDTATFLKLLAPEALSVDGGGVIPAAEFAKVMPQFKVTDTKLSNPRFIWASDDIAVLVYTWTGKGTMMGQPLPSPTYASTVWARRGDQWLALFHQETPVTAAPSAK